MLNYFQIYTGNGKGKTTAALGLAIRHLGSGGSVYIGQFLKKGHYSELKTIDLLKRSNNEIDLEQFGSGSFIIGEPSKIDHSLANKGLQSSYKAIKSGSYSLVILDEIIGAISLGLVSLDEANKLIGISKSRCELVFTGRDAHKDLIEKADLVTEMKEIKHYMNSGVEGRLGIES